MSRDIKFRAWDKVDLKIVDFDNLLEDYNISFILWCPDLTTNIVLMQYTGIKDENGKEIYEGDIVLQFPGSITELKYLIKWKPDRCGFYMLHEGNEESNLAFGNYREGLHVIGNIYDNPELLEVK